MIRVLMACVFAVVGAFTLSGTTTRAEAGWHHRSGCCGGPVAPTYRYRTVNSIRHVTHHHYVSRTNYVYRTHHIYDVTRVQPVLYVHNVTHVMHHRVSIVRPVHIDTTEYLPTHRIDSYSVVHSYDCSCEYHHGW